MFYPGDVGGVEGRDKEEKNGAGREREKTWRRNSAWNEWDRENDRPFEQWFEKVKMREGKNERKRKSIRRYEISDK